MEIKKQVATALMVTAQPPLPGQAAEDAALVESVAVKVRTAYVGGGLTTLLNVGKIVLDAMFSGSVDAFHAAEHRHMSYRALAKRDDIGISASSLWYAVALHENVRLLGRDDAHSIPTSHQRLLVHVHDLDARKQLARRTIAEHLTVKELTALIPPRQVVQPGKRGRGRPVVATATKAFLELKGVVSRLPDVTPESLHSLEGERRKKVARPEVEGVRTAVGAWLSALEAQLAAAEDAAPT